MEVAYITGPYRSKEGAHGIKRNVDNAEEVAIELWKLGFAVICPHKNTSFFDGASHDETWLKGDIELLKRSDFVVTVIGWENSEGSSAEVEFCKKNNIPVYYSVQEMIEKKLKK